MKSQITWSCNLPQNHRNPYAHTKVSNSKERDDFMQQSIQEYEQGDDLVPLALWMLVAMLGSSVRGQDTAYCIQ